MGYVNARDVAHLGPVLLPTVSHLGGDPALSPARSPLPAAPVYLLHGTDDNVVPAIESTLLGRQLEADTGHIEMSFPYFVMKKAPVSGVQSLMDYKATIFGEHSEGKTSVWLKVVVADPAVHDRISRTFKFRRC